MDIGAMMNINYHLIAKGRSSFQEYNCKNILYDPVSTVLGYHMHTSNCQWTSCRKSKRRQRRSCCSIGQLLLLKEYAKINEVQNEELVKENLKDQRWHTIR